MLASKSGVAAMKRETAFHIWYVVAAIVGVLLLQYFLATAQQVEPIP
jgi:hypothetical protein